MQSCNKTILIGSPVRQKPEILELFLLSLQALKKEGYSIAYCLVDDNDDERSSRLLEQFRVENRDPVCVFRVEPNENFINENFIRDEVTHRWTSELVWRVAAHKNRIIEYALANEFDYLFLVDSDLVLHPHTLVQLANSGKDIISEIFWTRWQPDMPELPQVWGCDHYTLYELVPGERLSPDHARLRQQEWLEKLRKPGVYRVGGLGACTLIARPVLERGVNFSPLYNLSYWGEDRHFCVRAVASGFELFVDTHFPAFHIYRVSDIPKAKVYLAENGIHCGVDLDDIGHHLLDKASQALVYYGTTDYYKHDLKAGLELFTPETRNVIYRERVKCKSEIERGFIVTYTEVSNMVPSNITSDSALVKAKVRNFGLHHNRNFMNEFEARVYFRKYEQQWLIESIDFSPEENASKPKKLLWWSQRVAKPRGNRITLAMVVRNEADRYLRIVLNQAKHIVDEAVIIDDCSTDDTPDLIRETIKDDIPLRLICNKEPLFENNESRLRQVLWEETIKSRPDWILCLDADELFEDKAVNTLRQMVNQEEFDYFSFRIYDFWDERHYREEPLWSAHLRYYILLVRYQPNFNYTWSQNSLYCGRFPSNIALLPGIQSQLRLKHLGWMNPRDRLVKYLRYKRLDPDGIYGIKEQYESILDPFPRLVRWQE
ncbi:MAG: glycosyltransferase [Firmicutes bacterium]|nr:glycosyltransferase [Bacillota bacterium]